MNLYLPGPATWAAFKNRMEELGWSEAQLAAKAGMSQPTVHRIINGHSDDPRISNIVKIATALGIGERQVVSEHPAQYLLPDNVTDGPRIKGRVPLISWVRASELCEAIDLYAPGDAEDWLDCPFPHSSKAFCLRVSGPSMLPEYRDGEIILVDPDIEARHGDDVVVRTPEGKTTFKRYNSTPEGDYLIALNPDMANRIIEVPEGTSICGVVTGSWNKRR